jgi:glyoxylase-like metal-dependent hydrolase (beta-lactamase superfamily II)
MDIIRMTSSPAGLLSNTYLIVAPAGVIVVDPPMLLSDARAVRRRLVDLALPLAAFIYTHPHPDHVNGATEIRDGLQVPVHAAAETDRVSREIDGPKRKFWTSHFPGDYPPETTFATHLARDGDTVDIAGQPFAVHEIGPGECATGALWITGDDAFVGDLAYSHVHPWLFEGRSAQWLRQLEQARPLLRGKRLHVGHGAPGGAELLDEQDHYIRVYREAVAHLAHGKDTLDDEAKGELARHIDSTWTGAPLLDLVTMSADSIAAELAAEETAAQRS